MNITAYGTRNAPEIEWIQRNFLENICEWTLQKKILKWGVGVGKIKEHISQWKCMVFTWGDSHAGVCSWYIDSVL